MASATLEGSMVIAFLLSASIGASDVTTDLPARAVEDVKTFAFDTVQVLSRPVHLETSDAWIVIPAAIGAGLMLSFDVRVYRWLRRWPDPRLGRYRLSYLSSFLGDGAVDLGIVMSFGVPGLLGDERARTTCIAGLEALTATALASRGLKLLFREERPSFDANGLHFFSRKVLRADSFPSGHTMSAFATAGVIAEEYPKVAPLAYAIATAVAIARIQERTHWPADVVVGSALGILFARQAVAINRRPVHVSPFTLGPGGGLALTGRTF